MGSGAWSEEEKANAAVESTTPEATEEAESPLKGKTYPRPEHVSPKEGDVEITVTFLVPRKNLREDREMGFTEVTGSCEEDLIKAQLEEMFAETAIPGEDDASDFFVSSVQPSIP